MRDNSLLLYVLAVKRQSLNETSHIADIQQYDSLLVIRLGFEPKTHSLEGCCSIQLSYRT